MGGKVYVLFTCLAFFEPSVLCNLQTHANERLFTSRCGVHDPGENPSRSELTQTGSPTAHELRPQLLNQILEFLLEIWIHLAALLDHILRVT